MGLIHNTILFNRRLPDPKLEKVAFLLMLAAFDWAHSQSTGNEKQAAADMQVRTRRPLAIQRHQADGIQPMPSGPGCPPPVDSSVSIHSNFRQPTMCQCLYYRGESLRGRWPLLPCDDCFRDRTCVVCRAWPPRRPVAAAVTATEIIKALFHPNHVPLEVNKGAVGYTKPVATTAAINFVKASTPPANEPAPAVAIAKPPCRTFDSRGRGLRDRFVLPSDRRR